MLIKVKALFVARFLKIQHFNTVGRSVIERSSQTQETLEYLVGNLLSSQGTKVT